MALGVPAERIEGWVSRKKLHPLHRGVYLVGPVAGRHTHEMAAVLACGRKGALSHQSAAYLHKLLPYPAQPGPFHVTAPSAHRHAGIKAHRASLAHYETRERHDIPVTAPVRTILDLAGCVSDAELEAAVAEACALRLVTPPQLTRMVVPGRRGARCLRALLDAGPKRTRSPSERHLLAALRNAGVDGFRTNERLGRWEVDFYWPAQRLAIEVDAYSTHSSPRAFRRDRRKDVELRSMGVEVQRFAADDIETMVPWIRNALSRT
jgi:very-short-patch-repair endonuclease